MKKKKNKINKKSQKYNTSFEKHRPTKDNINYRNAQKINNWHKSNISTLVNVKQIDTSYYSFKTMPFKVK